MKRIAVLLGLALCTCAALLLSCRQSDLRTDVIQVPQMADALAIRIVTNAALDEIFGRYDGIENGYEVDLIKGLVVYHEGPRLLNPRYQRLLEAGIREVGFEARSLGARANPPALLPTVDGPLQTWPSRHTATFSVPGMKTAQDVNIVVAAIAHARLGHDDPRIEVRRDSRSLRVTYEGLRLSRRNIEVAIACSGYAANDVPARLGLPDALPHGWTPVRL